MREVSRGAALQYASETWTFSRTTPVPQHQGSRKGTLLHTPLLTLLPSPLHGGLRIPSGSKWNSSLGSVTRSSRDGDQPTDIVSREAGILSAHSASGIPSRPFGTVESCQH